jgi:hypothetical protein
MYFYHFCQGKVNLFFDVCGTSANGPEKFPRARRLGKGGDKMWGKEENIIFKLSLGDEKVRKKRGDPFSGSQAPAWESILCQARLARIIDRK